MHGHTVASQLADQPEELSAHALGRRERRRAQPAEEEVHEVQLSGAHVQVVLRGTEHAPQVAECHGLLALRKVRQQVHQLVDGLATNDALLMLRWLPTTRG
jgi:hypothetical protein